MTPDVMPCRSYAEVAAIEATLPTGASAFHRKRFERTDGSVYLLAWHEGQAVGHVLVTPCSKYDEVTSKLGRFPEVNGLGVAEPHRRRGIATALMATARDIAKSMTGDRLGLAVEADNEPAVQLYKSLSFGQCLDINPVDIWAWIDDDGDEHIERDTCTYWTGPLKDPTLQSP